MNIFNFYVLLWLMLNMVKICIPAGPEFSRCEDSKAYNPDWPIWGDGGVYGNGGWDIFNDGHHGKCTNYRGECIVYRDDAIYDTGDVNMTFGLHSSNNIEWNVINPRSFGPFDLTNYKNIYFMYSFKCDGTPHNWRQISYQLNDNKLNN